MTPAKNRGPTARSVAAEVLVRVERDGAFAAAALDAELGRARQLDARDRGLATELVYGTLRVMPWIVARLSDHAKRGIVSLDPRTRANLCIATYQLFFLEKVPSFAAVSEAVDAVRHVNGPKVAAFANAVLRKLSAIADAARASGKSAPDDAAIIASTPPWIRDALARALGEEGAAAYLANTLQVPPMCLRVERAEERATWLARLREAGVEGAVFELGQVSPHAILARGSGRFDLLPGHSDGAWSVQEEGSQLVALALGARPGEQVLDACAGRGNKTAVLAREVGPDGAVDAADLHPAKLERLRSELGRLKLSVRSTYPVDWAVGSGDVGASYDRVLVDAPCSGIGTLRRRPELLARRAVQDLTSLEPLQLAIVARAAEHVKPGGRLVYAVCSVLREEGEDVIEKLRARMPRLVPAPFEGAAARAIAGDAPTLRLLPHVHGTDGYFLASFRAEE